MNVFDSIEGNEEVKKNLLAMVQNNAVGNSLLFFGPDAAKKDQFAFALAKLLMGKEAEEKIEKGNHPDVHVYKPEGKIGMHSIATMRHFCEEVYLPPFESKRKFFIIYEADRMLSYSANALLKTFEEPALDSVIILLSSNIQAFLPTVLSRCRTIRFQTPFVKKETTSVMKQEVFQILAREKFATYKDLQQAIAKLIELIEQLQEEKQENKQESNAFIEQLTAAQKQALEKELDGAATLNLQRELKQLLYYIHSWYRDVKIVQEGLIIKHLENPSYLEVFKSFKNKKIVSYERLETLVKKAILSVERSTSLSIVLENLFIELELV